MCALYDLMIGYYEQETLQRLRRGVVYAIGDRLRAEYERIVSPDVPPEFRELIAKLDQRTGQRES